MNDGAMDREDTGWIGQLLPTIAADVSDDDLLRAYSVDASRTNDKPRVRLNTRRGSPVNRSTIE